MLAHLKTFAMDKEKQQAEIKLTIDGYHKIIKTIQDKIQSNNNKMEDFNKTIEENFIKMDMLKGNESLISSFKNTMEDMKLIHNQAILKDNAKCHTLISETQENIKMLEKTLSEVSKMGLTQLETNM
jgi:predicted Rossmann fold nucleotide-binding protein DprA/Smf involved in DNA uptake